MQVFDFRDAQAELDVLINRARAGEEIVISQDGTPLVRLVPIPVTPRHRKRGSLEGQVVVPDSFFDPLPADETNLWGE